MHFIQVLEAKLADLKLVITFVLLLFFVYKCTNIKYKGIKWYKNILLLVHINSLFDVRFYSSLNITLNGFGS